MKTVCHVISGYFRNDARVFKRQCLSLKQEGFKVSILTNDGEPDDVLDGIKIYSCVKKWPRWKTLLFASYQFQKEAIEINADIYQLHSPELLPLAIKLKKLGKKVVYDAHEDMSAHILEKDWLPKFSRRFISIFISAYMNWVYKRIDEIVSPHLHVIKKINNDISKGILVANFPLIQQLDSEIIQNIKSRKPVVCYSGTVYNYSNQENIINALSSTKDVSYEVAGVIDDSYKNALLSLPCNDRVNFHGRINQLELRDLYLKSLIGIVIYDYKLNLGYNLGSFGTNKIFEYMEAGLPIICTDYILWQEIIEEYKCGVCVKPGDIESIASAINLINNDRDLATKMGNNSRKAAIEKFNWKTEKQKYVKVFHNL